MNMSPRPALVASPGTSIILGGIGGDKVSVAAWSEEGVPLVLAEHGQGLVNAHAYAQSVGESHWRVGWDIDSEPIVAAFLAQPGWFIALWVKDGKGVELEEPIMEPIHMWLVNESGEVQAVALQGGEFVPAHQLYAYRYGISGGEILSRVVVPPDALNGN